jgi:hypothetical protein
VEARGERGSLLAASTWMLVLHLLLFLLPFVGPLLAGFVGGRIAGTVGRSLIAALLPAIVVAVVAIVFVSVFGTPIVAVAIGTFVLAWFVFESVPLLLGAVLGAILG